MIESFARNVPMGLFKHSSLLNATYEMSLRDIEERSLNIQIMFVLQQGPACRRQASWLEKMIRDVYSVP